MPKPRMLGKICKKGHEHEPGSGLSWRYVRTDGIIGNCIACMADKRNTEEARARRKQYNQQYSQTSTGQQTRRSGSLRYWHGKGKETRSLWLAQNPDKVKTYQHRLHERRMADPERHARQILRIAFWNRMNQMTRVGKIKPSKDYGVNYDAIIQHIGPYPGPGFQLDHIIPVSYFDHTSPEQIKICWAPENMQWVERSVNRQKQDHMPSKWPVGLPFIIGTGIAVQHHPDEVQRLHRTADNMETDTWQTTDQM